MDFPAGTSPAGSKWMELKVLHQAGNTAEHAINDEIGSELAKRERLLLACCCAVLGRVEHDCAVDLLGNDRRIGKQLIAISEHIR